MKAPNYALALALAQAGWNNSETACRINGRAVARGHPGVAVDRSRVSDGHGVGRGLALPSLNSSLSS